MTGLGWHASPSFLIIGAQKAGTTALHDYLARHHSLVAASYKETNFFSQESPLNWPSHPDHERFVGFARSGAELTEDRAALQWYHSRFPVPLPGRRRMAFDTTPEYLWYPACADRIRAYRPDMKLIAILRDPVERAHSAWSMLHQFRNPPYLELRESRDFAAAVRDEIENLLDRPHTEGSNYVRRGLYARQLRPYFRRFPRANLLILEHGEFRSNTRATLARVCRFLAVDNFPESVEFAPVFVGRYEEELSADLRSSLGEFYRPHNEELFSLLGRRFDWNC